ncbi:hypothetical protein [Sneathiella litorea]|uniref:Uncharacterized protein n=1 Tax=Sneathiella litorea TaxID=2606216 RepID=A0A6L8W8A8_9PROT|nr:hypothetical protein [Sneathiella litorea]MZR30899.1 hypothetical protein [Sneathiella litorea]
MPKNVFDVAAFDLKVRSEAGAPLTLRHPKTGETLPAVIWLQGEDAETYRKCLRAQIDRQIAERKLELTAAELEERLIERLAAITQRFENIEFDGVTYDTTPANVIKLYREHLWIREQVAAFVEDRANFLP